MWIKNLLAPAALLAIYFLMLDVYISHGHQLPNGVNLTFARTLFLPLLGLVAIGLVGYLLIPSPKNTSVLQNHAGFSWREGLLILLPITPIVQYILSNRDILFAFDVLYLLAFFVIASVTFVLLIPYLLRHWTSSSLMQIAGLVFVFMVTNMASLSATFHWFEKGDIRIQLSIAVILFLLIWFLFTSKHRTLLYLLITAYFFSNSLNQLNLSSLSEPLSLSSTEHVLSLKLADQDATTTPNVYLLVYDSYVANETMLQYGIDNSVQEAYLVENGFTLYPHTYTIGGWSAASMSTLLNISTTFSDSNNAASGSGVVHHLFKELGYSSFGIFGSDNFFRARPSSYDLSYPERKASNDLLMDGILLGEFRFNLGFTDQDGLNFVQAKQALLQNPPQESFFLYAHSFSPGHSQNSGVCLPDEKEKYATSLEGANHEMQEDLSLILDQDPGAIIIVAGDHGPSLSKNCFSTGEGGYNLREITRYDIQDRFGTFLAIRWPTQTYKQYDQIVVLQDLFPAIFAYLYQDTSILNVRIPPVILYEPSLVSGAYVEDGIIRGGVNDGEPLFISD